MFQLFQIIVLIFSAIFHEYMHGWMADRLGDTTAKDSGRLTLNPLPHIDPFGSILLPMFFIISGSSFVLGWAKPVPFNPYNLSDQKYGSAKVALAGPLGNLSLALFFGLILRFGGNWLAFYNETILSLLAIVVYINLLLMVFNLMPVPPMDGSKILEPFLPYSWRARFASLDRYGMIFVLIFVILGFSIIVWPITDFLFNLIVG